VKEHFETFEGDGEFPTGPHFGAEHFPELDEQEAVGVHEREHLHERQGRDFGNRFERETETDHRHGHRHSHGYARGRGFSHGFDHHHDHGRRHGDIHPHDLSHSFVHGHETARGHHFGHDRDFRHDFRAHFGAHLSGFGHGFGGSFGPDAGGGFGGGFGGRGGRGEGRGGGGGDPTGPRGRGRRPFDHGRMRVVILSLIAEKPRHGYDIIKTIEERFRGLYSPSPGVIYPTLTLLEEMGYATVQESGGKKLYTITQEGEAFLKVHPESEMPAEDPGPRGGPNPDVMHAMGELRNALRSRFRQGSLTDEQTAEIIKTIAEAAAKIESL
jgi:DNA-binding PadR family transcriptional regulator